MANLRFVDGAGDDAKYRKASGVGSDADPFITDVSVSSIAPGSAASSLGKAEDAAHASGDVGVMALAVRKDTAAATSGTDGDYQPPISNARGATWVAVEDGAGGQVTAFSGGTQYTEDAAAAANPVGTASILVRKDTPADEVSADGDNIAARATKYGATYVQVVSSAGAYVDTFGGGTQYTEDAAAAADPVGNTVIMVRDDVLSAQTSADGDNIAVRGTDKGELYVKHVDSIPVTNAGTFAVQDATVQASLSVLDDWDETNRAAVNTIAGQVGVQGASGVVTALTQRVVLATDVALPAGTNAIGKLAANSGVDIGDVDVLTLPNVTLAAGTNTNEVVGDVAHDAVIAGNPLTVGGVASAAAPADVSADQDAVRAWFLRNGAQAAVLTAAGALIGGDAANGLDVDVTRVPAPLSTTGGGTEATALRVTIANNSTGSLNVTNAGAFDVQATGTVSVNGTVAHDGVDSGNPIKIGAKAIAHGTNPTAVAAADRTDLYANRAGVQFVIGGHPNTQTFRLRWTTAQTDVSLCGAIAAGMKLVITSICLTVDEATTVGVAVRVGFGTANTPANTVTTGVVLDHDGIVPGGGIVYGNGGGILGVGADDQELRVTAEATTSGSAILWGTYYTIES